MDVKSTQCITRKEAEEKFVDLILQDESLKRHVRSLAVAMDNDELENEIEKIDDRLCGGESFRNYVIVSVREPAGSILRQEVQGKSAAALQESPREAD